MQEYDASDIARPNLASRRLAECLLAPLEAFVDLLETQDQMLVQCPVAPIGMPEALLDLGRAPACELGPLMKHFLDAQPVPAP